ncbi:MAG TPA: DUF2231 domain-containing protein [Candidatus Acidoferrales bacterium]|nr:DUF2231 domain-containing protein [Candidatus Acidoferrales bacterium]
MAKPAVIADHPLHPMLIVFPVGLWIFSFVSDLIAILGGGPIWSRVAFYTMAGGLIGAAAAAVPGFFDYFTITDRRAARTANFHMALNLFAAALYALNLFIRIQAGMEALFAVFLSLAGVVLLAVSGWLGGDLVYVQGMGVKAPESREQKARPNEETEARRLRGAR